MESHCLNVQKRLQSLNTEYDQQEWYEYLVTYFHCTQDRQQGQQVLQQGLNPAKGISRMPCSLSVQHMLTLVMSR